MEGNLIKISINNLLNLSLTNLETFVKINDKYIRYTASEGNNSEQLIKLRDRKNVQYMYIYEKDYNKYLEANKDAIKKNIKAITSLNLDEANTLNQLSQAKESLQYIFQNFGITNEFKDEIKQIAKLQTELLSKTDDFKKLIGKESSDKKDLKEMFLNYFSLKLLNGTTHCTNHSKEILTLGLTLRSILLTEDEYWESYEKQPQSEKVLDNPRVVAKMLTPLGIPYAMDLGYFLQTFGERFEGDGYPNFMNHKRLGLHAIVYRTSLVLFDKLIEKNFKAVYYKECFTETKLYLEKYAKDNPKIDIVLNSLKKMEAENVIL